MDEKCSMTQEDFCSICLYENLS